jgi:hypothetical protein
MTDDRVQRIEAVIAECEAQGVPWTNAVVYARTGGKYSALSQYLKARRAQARAASAVAVVEEDGEADEGETPVPASVSADRPAASVSRLFQLIEQARTMDEALTRHTWEHGQLIAHAKAATLAAYQATRDARQLVGQVRQAAYHARQAPPSTVREAMRRLDTQQRALAVLVGTAEAQRVAEVAGYRPAWLQG